GNDFDALRQDRGIEHVNPVLERFENFGRVLALAHQNDAGHNVIGIILADNALDGDVADGDLRDVFDHDRGAAVSGDDNVFDFIRRAQQSDAANEILLRTLADFAAADIAIRATQ